jgi:hypothetical protein
MEKIYLLDLNDNKHDITEEVNEEVKEKLEELKVQYKIPEGLYDLLLKNKSLQTSIVFNDYYHSVDIERILELRENYPNFIDLFWRFIGLGNMELISMCVYTQKFFLRRGGGGNDFDREESFLEYKNYKLEDTTESFDFDRVLEIINEM